MKRKNVQFRKYKNVYDLKQCKVKVKQNVWCSGILFNINFPQATAKTLGAMSSCHIKDNYLF